jgi:hypothetical protein
VIGVGFTLLSSLPTLIFAKENSLANNMNNINDMDAPREKVGILFVFVKIYRAFRDMPGTMARVTLLFFFSWYLLSFFSLVFQYLFVIFVHFL